MHDTLQTARQHLKALQPYIRTTPVLHLNATQNPVQTPLVLKAEYVQCSGSFKARGAFHALLQMPIGSAGVTAASGGNHGAAVALAAQTLGHRARIFVPTIASPAKVALLKRFGAEVEITGIDFQEALQACQAYQAETSATFVHAFDQPEVLAGQGTLAAELLEQTQDFDTVLISVGGGGLIGGMASVLQNKCNIVAVEPESCACCHYALAAGKPVENPVGGIAADSLGARQLGELAFAAVQQWVDASVLVPDQSIQQAQAWLWQNLRMAVEPAAAAGLAALLSGRYQAAPNERIALILCGANMSLEKFQEALTSCPLT